MCQPPHASPVILGPNGPGSPPLRSLIPPWLSDADVVLAVAGVRIVPLGRGGNRGGSGGAVFCCNPISATDTASASATASTDTSAPCAADFVAPLASADGISAASTILAIATTLRGRCSS